MRTLGIIMATLLLSACGSRVPYEVPLLPESVMAKRLTNACGRSAEAEKPLLVEFSAEWCPGCNDLLQQEAREPLTAELAQWERVDVNVGDFDRHVDLMRAYGVESIPHWALVFGADCTKPAPQWSPSRSRGVPDGNARSIAEYLVAIRQTVAAGNPLPP